MYLQWSIWCLIFGQLLTEPLLSPGGLLANGSEVDFVGIGHERQGRLFPFYTIGRIANIPCRATNGLTGTCLIRGQCSDNAGLAGGTCSTNTNQATCCIISRTCGGSSNLNSTYFNNQGYPALTTAGGSCSFTVTPGSNICQLRIDFRALTLAQPDGDGNCLTDVLTITGGSTQVPNICGENSGQHVYVNFAEANPITIRVSTSGSNTLSRQWSFELSQIACDSEWKAPSGCLQYYMEPTGVISSFNYNFGANPNLNSLGLPGSRQIASQQYGICIRPAADQCSITYSLPTNAPFGFTVSEPADAVAADMIGSGALMLNGQLCTTDYIIIPDPTISDAAVAGTEFLDRFCGLGLYPVTSNVLPFVVYVVWDENESPDSANRGFSLAYSQNSCGI
ncbi:uncharacterized protein LOC129757023 [Uranotaenia lowii]|uniref:uncharacterized protein LOC129757023 n=1 Tax=Uranotaenia lowii TaxID=190385 RepID=UPI00247971B1|nr:uncharacterized protein LOC129757023 [Uranotaenia lowii]